MPLSVMVCQHESKPVVEDELVYTDHYNNGDESDYIQFTGMVNGVPTEVRVFANQLRAMLELVKK